MRRELRASAGSIWIRAVRVGWVRWGVVRWGGELTFDDVDCCVPWWLVSVRCVRGETYVSSRRGFYIRRLMSGCFEMSRGGLHRTTQCAGREEDSICRGDVRSEPREAKRHVQSLGVNSGVRDVAGMTCLGDDMVDRTGEGGGRGWGDTATLILAVYIRQLIPSRTLCFSVRHSCFRQRRHDEISSRDVRD